jgi:hypothetical protein
MKPWGLAKELDEETLRHLVVVKKLTDQQIADAYETTAPTIRYHRIKANPPIIKNTAPRIDHRADGAVPWSLDVGQGHHMDPTARMLRNRNRLKRGLSVPEDAKVRVEKAEKHLAERNWVIDYNRQLGFHTIRRDPKIDRPDVIVRIPPKK